MLLGVLLCDCCEGECCCVTVVVSVVVVVAGNVVLSAVGRLTLDPSPFAVHIFVSPFHRKTLATYTSII